MANVELRVTALDAKVFTIEPLGTELPIEAGDQLTVEIASRYSGEPELDRSLSTLTLYLWAGCTVRVAINGQTVYRCDTPLPAPPGGVSTRELVAGRKGPPSPPRQPPGRTGLAGLFVRGEIELDHARDCSQFFIFKVRELKAVQAQLAGMYIELDVRFTADGQLAYHLEVPDLQMTPWTIPVAVGEPPPVGSAALRHGVCPTFLRERRDEEIALTAHFEDLVPDFSGTYAQGRRALLAGDRSGARRILEPLVAKYPQQLPLAHQLLGHCYRDCGDYDQAIQRYRAGLAAATNRTGYLLPVAAGLLADLGVAYVQEGQDAKAAHCLYHSLRLRPSHPAALGAYVTLFPQWQTLWEAALSRITTLGNQPDLLARLSDLYAARQGRAVADLTSRFQSARVDLALPLFTDSRPSYLAKFLKELDSAQGPPTRPDLRGTSRAFGELGVLAMNLEIALGGVLLAYGIRESAAALVGGLLLIVGSGFCRLVVLHQPRAFVLGSFVNLLVSIVSVVASSFRTAAVSAVAMTIFLFAFRQAEQQGARAEGEPKP